MATVLCADQDCFDMMTCVFNQNKLYQTR